MDDQAASFLSTTLPSDAPVPGPERWTKLRGGHLAPLPAVFDPGTGQAPPGNGPWVLQLNYDGSLTWVLSCCDGSPAPTADAILMEDGGYVLAEDGSHILLE